MRFAVDTSGTTPDYFKRIIDDSAKSVGQQRGLASLHERFASFYTTFYIFDGAPRAYAVDANLLRFNGALPRDTIVYRAIRPEVIDTALAVLSTLDLSAAMYFRCLVNRIDPKRAPGAAPRQFASLIDLARQHASLRTRGERGEPLQRLTTQIAAHPAGLAVDQGRFGAYLGCPKRDLR